MAQLVRLRSLEGPVEGVLKEKACLPDVPGSAITDWLAGRPGCLVASFFSSSEWVDIQKLKRLWMI